MRKFFTCALALFCSSPRTIGAPYKSKKEARQACIRTIQQYSLKRYGLGLAKCFPWDRISMPDEEEKKLLSQITKFCDCFGKNFASIDPSTIAEETYSLKTKACLEKHFMEGTTKLCDRDVAESVIFFSVNPSPSPEICCRQHPQTKNLTLYTMSSKKEDRRRKLTHKVCERLTGKNNDYLRDQKMEDPKKKKLLNKASRLFEHQKKDNPIKLLTEAGLHIGKDQFHEIQSALHQIDSECSTGPLFDQEGLCSNQPVQPVQSAQTGKRDTTRSATPETFATPSTIPHVQPSYVGPKAGEDTPRDHQNLSKATPHIVVKPTPLDSNVVPGSTLQALPQTAPPKTLQEIPQGDPHSEIASKFEESININTDETNKKKDSHLSSEEDVWAVPIRPKVTSQADKVDKTNITPLIPHQSEDHAITGGEYHAHNEHLDLNDPAQHTLVQPEEIPQREGAAGTPLEIHTKDIQKSVSKNVPEDVSGNVHDTTSDSETPKKDLPHPLNTLSSLVPRYDKTGSSRREEPTTPSGVNLEKTNKMMNKSVKEKTSQPASDSRQKGVPKRIETGSMKENEPLRRVPDPTRMTFESPLANNPNPVPESQDSTPSQVIPPHSTVDSGKSPLESSLRNDIITINRHNPALLPPVLSSNDPGQSGSKENCHFSRSLDRVSKTFEQNKEKMDLIIKVISFSVSALVGLVGTVILAIRKLKKDLENPLSDQGAGNHSHHSTAGRLRQGCHTSTAPNKDDPPLMSLGIGLQQGISSEDISSKE